MEKDKVNLSAEVSAQRVLYKDLLGLSPEFRNAVLQLAVMHDAPIAFNSGEVFFAPGGKPLFTIPAQVIGRRVVEDFFEGAYAKDIVTLTLGSCDVGEEGKTSLKVACPDKGTFAVYWSAMGEDGSLRICEVLFEGSGHSQHMTFTQSVHGIKEEFHGWEAADKGMEVWQEMVGYIEGDGRK